MVFWGVLCVLSDCSSCWQNHFFEHSILACGQRFVIVFKIRKRDIFTKSVYCYTELWFCRERTCLSVSLDLFHIHWKTKRRLTSSVYFQHLFNFQMCWRCTGHLYTNLFLQFSILIGYFCLFCQTLENESEILKVLVAFLTKKREYSEFRNYYCQ